MSKRKNKPKLNEPNPVAPPRPKQSRSKSKIWCFRLVLLILSNVLVLGGIEFGARLLGIGYPSAFFSAGSAEGQRVIEPNHRFFWSFFPKALSRSPQPFQFKPAIAKETQRIFILGESAAMGDPEPAIGMARILETMLEARHPKQQFEVINLAVTAINSHVIRPIAMETAKHKADFWCVYMGNNEVHGQFGPGTVFGSTESRLPWIRASLAVKRTRIGQIANSLASGLQKSDEEQAQWGGMAMFNDHQVYFDDPRLQGVYSNFQANLQDIIAAGLAAQTRVLVSSVAVNLRGSSPFKSAPPSGLSEDEKATWQTYLEQAERLLDAGLASDALPILAQARDLFDGHAETHYLIGQCHWQLMDYAAAHTSYTRARDLDGLRFRTDSRLNQIIREVADNHPSANVKFVNGEGMVAYNAPNRIPGDQLFWDHVHFRFPGNYLVALTFARSIEEALYSKEEIANLPNWISLSDCAQALTLTRWVDYETTQTMRQRLREEPFSSQSVFSARDASLRAELEQHLAGISPEAFAVHQDLFQKAFEKDPEDYVLRDLFARYLLSQNQVDAAASEWAKVVKQVPSHLMAHFHRGAALAEIPERAGEAEQSLRRALEIRPDTVNIMVALGQALYTQKRYQASLDQYDAALELRPSATDALIKGSRALIGLNRKGEAIQYLERAKKLSPTDAQIAAELAALRGR